MRFNVVITPAFSLLPLILVNAEDGSKYPLGALKRQESATNGTVTAVSFKGASLNIADEVQTFTAYTTTCASPSIFTINNRTYTISTATTLTIASCNTTTAGPTPQTAVPISQISDGQIQATDSGEAPAATTTTAGTAVNGTSSKAGAVSLRVPGMIELVMLWLGVAGYGVVLVLVV